jgi:hypothetical protein
MIEEEKLLKPGGIDRTSPSAKFVGAFRPSEEQLRPREPGEPPSQASLSLVDRWIAVLTKLAEKEEWEQVRAYKKQPPEDDAEPSE